MKLTEIYTKTSNIKVRDNSNKVFLIFDMKKDVIHELNATAYEIFQIIDGYKKVDIIIKELASNYNIPEERIKEDVKSILKRFLKIGIIHPVDYSVKKEKHENNIS